MSTQALGAAIVLPQRHLRKKGKLFVIGKVLRSTLREMQLYFSSSRRWVVMGLVGLVLGVSGPFNTFEALSVAPRIAYWIFVTIITFASGTLASIFAMHLFKATNARPLIAKVAGAIAPVLIVVPIVLIINMLTFSNYTLSAPEMWGFIGYIAAIVLVVSALGFMSDRQEKSDASAKGARAKSDTDFSTLTAPYSSALMGRIEHHKRGQLISVSVQDHYVNVFTNRGQSLLLMRMVDAIKETEGTKGLQVHRSHWVAHDGIVKILKRDGKTSILTSDDREIPVSRTYVPALKDAGLLPIS